MKDSHESQPIIERNNLEKQGNLENIDLIPIKIIDQRNHEHMNFDLNKFITVISRLRTEDLFRLSNEFEPKDYGKYMHTFASNESDNWNEAVKNATAIEIILTTQEKNYGRDYFIGKTNVEVRVLMSEKEGRVFVFKFNGDGTYSNGNFKNVYLQKILQDPNKVNDFTLEIDNDSKKLKSLFTRKQALNYVDSKNGL